jgi:SAM-dependent methyltransferase
MTKGNGCKMALDFYTDGTYLENNPDWHIGESPWKTQAILQMIQRSHLHPRSVCEVGCGAGEILRLLQPELDPNCDLVGYDIAPQAIKLGQLRGENEHLHLFAKDFLEEKDCFYDVILMIDVLEHFENCFEVLRDIKTKSEYKIFLLPLDISALSVALNELIDYRFATGHLHFFTKDLALQLLRDNGYEVLDAFYYLRPFDGNVWGDKHPLSLFIGVLRLLRRIWYRIPRYILYSIHRDLAVRLLGGWKLVVLAR